MTQYNVYSDKQTTTLNHENQTQICQPITDEISMTLHQTEGQPHLECVAIRVRNIFLQILAICCVRAIATEEVPRIMLMIMATIRL